MWSTSPGTYTSGMTGRDTITPSSRGSSSTCGSSAASSASSMPIAVASASASASAFGLGSASAPLASSSSMSASSMGAPTQMMGTGAFAAALGLLLSSSLPLLGSMRSANFLVLRLRGAHTLLTRSPRASRSSLSCGCHSLLWFAATMSFTSPRSPRGVMRGMTSSCSTTWREKLRHCSAKKRLVQAGVEKPTTARSGRRPSPRSSAPSSVATAAPRLCPVSTIS
mmetsp:Transcript_26577/g.83118  ORF Transcript_26577/g.83118 Transcript_26577/m.83118 type:complete len:225 (-) Transcript_26577:822-1496(-)